jgi:tetratricopeptide (TPR) repeat protein
MKRHDISISPIFRSGLANCIAVLIFVILIGSSVKPARGDEPASEKLAVAILEFENTSSSDELSRLDRALQSMLTTDLSVSRDLQLIERARLNQVRAEIDLVETGYLDAATAAKLGKGVGAKAILTGSFWVRDDDIRIDARLVHVETGQVILAEEISGKAKEFAALEKQLAGKVLEATGIRLSAFEKASLSKPHTKNLLAATRYGEALHAEDEGDLRKARASSKSAVELDPSFELAKALQIQIGEIIESTRNEQFLRNAVILADFEDSLNGWKFDHPAYVPDGYPTWVKENGPKQALFTWISQLGPTIRQANQISPSEALFSYPNPLGNRDGIYSRLYLELGGADPVLFWCDVFKSDPNFAPKTPLTTDMVDSNSGSTPIFGPNPRNYFLRLPDLCEKKFTAEAWVKGDFETALETLKDGERKLKVLVPQTAFLPFFEQLKKVIEDPQEFARRQAEVKRKRQIWTTARGNIIMGHYSRQSERFEYTPSESTDLDLALVRERSALDYASNISESMSDISAKLRTAKKLQTSLLEDADGADFVARETPVQTTDKETHSVKMMHVAGCLDSFISPSDIVALKLPAPMFGYRANVFTPALSADEGIKKDWCQCPKCRPFRWINKADLTEYLQNRLPVVVARVLSNEGSTAEFELEMLATVLKDTPVPKVRETLRKACEFSCRNPSRNRKFHADLLQAYAGLASADDVAWLGEILSTTPWWDVRMNVAAVLGCIGTRESDAHIEKAIKREPYYFVGHSLEASRARNRTKAIYRQVNLFDAAIELSDLARARTIIEKVQSNLNEVANLPGPLAEQMNLMCEKCLSYVCYLEKNIDQQIIHLRRIVDLDPKSVSDLNNLGYTLATNGGDLSEAEEFLREGVRLNEAQVAESAGEISRDFFILDSLGYVLYKKGNLNEAKKFVLASLESPDAQLLESYDHLGDIHLAMGEQTEAINAYRKGIAVAGETEAEQELLRAVQRKLSNLVK